MQRGRRSARQLTTTTGNRRFKVPAIGLLALTLVSTSCASFLPQPLPVREPESAGGPPCADATTRSCALPYPSDEFAVADPSTATGIRIEMPDALFPDYAHRALGPGASLDDAFDGADGFASTTPVIFELERSVDPSSLPSDGGDIVAVYDTASGERVPIRAEMSIDSIRFGSINTVLMVWPKVRYEYGHTYVARLGRGLRADVGDLQRAPGVATVSTGYMAEVRSALGEIEGDRWSDVVSATSFTIRSRENATGPMTEMARVARAEDHSLRNLSVMPPFLVTNASAVVAGEVALTDFRDAAGVARPEHGGETSWEKFLMVLPSRPAGPDGAPVVVYGHGLSVAKETMVAVASQNAAHGLATVGIDVPNHGDRQDEGGYLTDLSGPATFGRLASMPLQGVIDNVSLIRSVQQHFAELRFEAPPLGSTPPPLDPSRIFYEGTSMGGVLGAAEIPIAPEIDGAFLQVAGVGTADIIFHSSLWLLFAAVIPDALDAGDAAALQGVGTMLLDPGDAVNVLDDQRAGRTPIFVQYGIGDGILPNYASDRLMTLLDLPLVGPDIAEPSTPVRRLDSDAVPADGWGASQTWATSWSMELMAFGAHVSFLEPQAMALLDSWLESRLAATGVTPGG